MLITVSHPNGGVPVSTSVEVNAVEAGALQQSISKLTQFTNHGQGKATQHDVFGAVRSVKTTATST